MGTMRCCAAHLRVGSKVNVSMYLSASPSELAHVAEG